MALLTTGSAVAEIRTFIAVPPEIEARLRAFAAANPEELFIDQALRFRASVLEAFEKLASDGVPLNQSAEPRKGWAPLLHSLKWNQLLLEQVYEGLREHTKLRVEPVESKHDFAYQEHDTANVWTIFGAFFGPLFRRQEFFPKLCHPAAQKVLFAGAFAVRATLAENPGGLCKCQCCLKEFADILCCWFGHN